MLMQTQQLSPAFSRSPLGLRGLKFKMSRLYGTPWLRRSPLGLRGLKLLAAVLPAMAAIVAAHSGCVD